MIGSQFTILWDANDLKISHVNNEMADRIAYLLEEKFVKEALLTKTRGNVDVNPEMTFDCS